MWEEHEAVVWGCCSWFPFGRQMGQHYRTPVLRPLLCCGEVGYEGMLPQTGQSLAVDHPSCCIIFGFSVSWIFLRLAKSSQRLLGMNIPRKSRKWFHRRHSVGSAAPEETGQGHLGPWSCSYVWPCNCCWLKSQHWELRGLSPWIFQGQANGEQHLPRKHWTELRFKAILISNFTPATTWPPDSFHSVTYFPEVVALPSSEKKPLPSSEKSHRHNCALKMIYYMNI